jgi:hypothetical protein
LAAYGRRLSSVGEILLIVLHMKKFLAYLFVLLLAASFCEAQEFSKVGTGSAQFLKIDIGARSVALGGAYVAMADDIFSMYWNPAGVARMKRKSVGGSYKNYIADLNHNYVGLVLPLNETSGLGFHAIFMNTDPIEITTIEQPRGTGTFYDYTNLAIGASYGRWMTDRLTLGATVKFCGKAFTASANALAFDIGSLFDTGILGIRLGMSLSNFGSSMRLDGPDIDAIVDTDTGNDGNRTTPSRLRTLEWPLPLIFRMGIRMDLLGGLNPHFKNERNRLTAAIAINDPLDNNLRTNYGVEYEWNRLFTLRAGYYGNYDTNTLGMTLGGGLNFNLGGKLFIIDYAYQDFGILESVHQYSLKLEL